MNELTDKHTHTHTNEQHAKPSLHDLGRGEERSGADLGQRGKQTNKQTSKQTHKQTSKFKQTNKQANKQTN